MGAAGIFLKFGATALRVLEFGCAAIVLGIYSYFLAVLSKHNAQIPQWEKAVEGMSGAAVVYTIFGILLTLCLGGKAIFAFIAIVLDILFAAAFAAIAYYARHGASRCTGIVNTPIGTGAANSAAPGAGSFGYACSLNTAVFAVSIVSIILFLITAAWQILLVRNHKKEKRFGPSPTNNYTSGTKTPFWRRNKKSHAHATKDAEMATAGTTHHATTHNNARYSHETGMTGSTVAPGHHGHVNEPKYGQPGYGQQQGYATNY